MNTSPLHRWAKKENYVAVHRETISFPLNRKEMEYELIYNLNFYNLDIGLALVEWAYKTKNHTALSFCGFIMCKENEDMRLVCVPKKEWFEFERMQQEMASSEKKCYSGI